MLNRFEVRDPRGAVFLVRAVPRGAGLRDVGPGDGSVLASVIEMAVAAIQSVRVSRSSGWTVGVIRRGGPIVGERLVVKEHVTAHADVGPRLEALADRVRNGDHL